MCVCVCDWDHIEYRYSGSRFHSLYRHISLSLFHLFRLSSKCGCIWTLCSIGDETAYKTFFVSKKSSLLNAFIKSVKSFVLCLFVYFFIDIVGISHHFRHYLRKKIEIIRDHACAHCDHIELQRSLNTIFGVFLHYVLLFHSDDSLCIEFGYHNSHVHIFMRVISKFCNGKFLWQEIKIAKHDYIHKSPPVHDAVVYFYLIQSSRFSNSSAIRQFIAHMC